MEDRFILVRLFMQTHLSVTVYLSKDEHLCKGKSMPYFQAEKGKVENRHLWILNSLHLKIILVLKWQTWGWHIEIPFKNLSKTYHTYTNHNLNFSQKKGSSIGTLINVLYDNTN